MAGRGGLIASALMLASACDGGTAVPDGAVDAPPFATLTLVRAYVGPTIVEAPEPVMPTLFAGTELVDGTEASPGVWQIPNASDLSASFSIPGEKHYVHTSIFSRGLALPTTATTLVTPVPINLRTESPPVNTSVALDISLPTPSSGEVHSLFTLGTWTDWPVSPADGATSLATTLELPVVTDDRAIVTKYSNGRLVGSFLSSAPMQTGGTWTITGAMTDVALNKTVDVTFAATSALTHFARLWGDYGTPASQSGWKLTVAPGADVGLTTGPSLGWGDLSTNVNVTYGNPFPWPEVLELWGYVVRGAVGRVGAPLYRGFYFQLVPGEPTTLTLPAVPTGVTLGGTPLVTDNAVLALSPTDPIPIEITAENATPDTIYKVELRTYSLHFQESGAVFEIVSTTPSFFIPGGLLRPTDSLYQVERAYLLRVTCMTGGYVDASTGQLRPQLPVAAAYLDSSTFVFQQ